LHDFLCCVETQKGVFKAALYCIMKEIVIMTVKPALCVCIT